VHDQHRSYLNKTNIKPIIFESFTFKPNPKKVKEDNMEVKRIADLKMMSDINKEIKKRS